MSQSKTTKEIKIVARPVVTIDAVKRDTRKLKLLHIIDMIGQISEKGLTQLIYKLKNDKGIDLGYKFFSIAGVPNSKELLEDVRVLLYLGLVESDPITRKLRLTSLGKEFLGSEGSKVSKEDLDNISNALDELKTYIQSLDSTTEIVIRGMRSLRGRRRRRR
ncbi:MAG: hypothetical protein B6U85_00435 [Desulfurococcales archaeon ex4484_42]|nr:MAG: hypothetical protein B6U85_00435 [Desulfurococcales archaeon ex4484_42]